jgi:hypothetical protein
MKNFRTYVIGLLLIPFAAVAALFYIPGTDGKPMMNMRRLRQSFGSVDLGHSLMEKVVGDVRTIRNKINGQRGKESEPEALTGGEKSNEPPEAPSETIYRWRDENGNLHFSDQPPPGGVENIEVFQTSISQVE